MTQELWRLDDTSVASGSNFTRVNSNYTLNNTTAGTLSRTTTSPTPIQGGGCYRFNDSNVPLRLRTAGGSELSAGVFYVDYYLYLPSSVNADNYQLLTTGNDSTVEYTVASFFDDGKIGWASYDTTNGFVQTAVSAAGVIPKSEWVRVAVKTAANGAAEIKVFKGKNINGTTADSTISTTWSYSNWEWVGIACADTSGSAPWFDSVILDNSAYPTRLEGSASSTATASANASLEKTSVYISSVTTSTLSGTAQNRTATATLPNLVSGDTVIAVGYEIGTGDDFFLFGPASTSLTLTSQVSVASAATGQSSRRKLFVSTAQVTSSVTAPQITMNMVAANSIATTSNIYLNVFVLKRAASTAFGAKTSSTSSTNNLTTNSITTTGGSSLVFGFAFDGASNPYLDTTDLYLPGSSIVGANPYPANVGISTWAGWKLAGSSGSTVTANFDGQSTNTVDWMYGLLEVLPPGGAAVTADASSTATATGTATMSNSRVAAGSSTVTASGTITASNGRVVDASGTGTASGTAASNNARVLDAAATITATGTAAATITSVITIDAAGTVTASGTTAAASTQLMAAAATITASGVSTGSIRPIITVDAAGSVTATAASTVSKGQSLAAAATITATGVSTIISIIPIVGSATATATASGTVLVLTKGRLYGGVTAQSSLYGKQSSTLLTN